MAVGSFFSAAPTAQNSTELHFCFINSFIPPSLVGSLISLYLVRLTYISEALEATKVIISNTVSNPSTSTEFSNLSNSKIFICTDGFTTHVNNFMKYQGVSIDSSLKDIKNFQSKAKNIYLFLP